MGLKLLHTADWQLGAPFAQHAGDVGAVLREERFAVVRRIADLARTREVDLVLVAGDVFDANMVHDRTIYRLFDALAGFPGPWVMLPGNHDSAVPESVWHRLERMQPPANLHVAREPAPLAFKDGSVTILPAPLQQRHALEDLTVWMDQAATPSGTWRIGLAHGAIEGRLPGAAEAMNPVAPDRASRAGLDYLALGDWHGLHKVDARSWYSGTPEQDRPRDNEPGYVLLVELEAPGAVPVVEPVRTGRFRWYRRELELSALDSTSAGPVLDQLVGQLGEPESALLWLRLAGSVDLATRDALEAQLARWSGRLRHLEVQDEAVMEPSVHDLARLADGGLVDKAATRLRALAVPGEAGAAARLALRLLWQEQNRAGGA